MCFLTILPLVVPKRSLVGAAIQHFNAVLVAVTQQVKTCVYIYIYIMTAIYQ